MQRGKSLLEVVKEGLVGRVNRCARCGHVPLIIIAKVIALAAILVPCLLQFPLAAFGQDRPDGIDSGLVLKKRAGECVEGERIVADSGDAARKGGLVLNDGRTKNGNSLTTDGQSVANSLPRPLRYDANDKHGKKAKAPSLGVSKASDPFDHGLWWLLVGAFVVAVMPAVIAKHNVNVTGDRGKVRPQGADARGRPC